MENNKFIIYDIAKNSFEAIEPINPSQQKRPYLYEDDDQFNVFVICRTSELFTDKNEKREVRQRAKYQIYSFYEEKLGIFSVNEIIISHTNSSIYVQMIGLKNILLSKKIIQNFDWLDIKNTYSLPYVDMTERDGKVDGRIKGC